MDWTGTISLSDDARRDLTALPQRRIARGTPLFHAGDTAQGFVVVMSGRIEVFLTGPSGREIMLYAVEPGQSCVQTTLGLMAGEAYTGEAHAATDAQIVLIPKGLFTGLMDQEAGFRAFVMESFAQRMTDVTRLLEQVAFGRVEARLAATLLDLAEGGMVQATQGELAARIGSAREVVSRRLEAFHRNGWVETDRGLVRLTDIAALRHAAAAPL